MRKRKIKLIMGILVLSMSVNLVSFSNQNTKANNQKWKKVELRPDLNKDGKKDKLIVQYIEEDDKVYTKFIPHISGGKQGQIEEKVFKRSTFQTEFGEYTKKYIENYAEKDMTKLQNQVISQEEVIENNKFEENTTTNVTEEIKETEKVEKPSKPEKVKQSEMTATGEDFIKGPYDYVAYYLKSRPKNLSFNYKYSKRTPMDLDEFVFIKTTTNIRKEPNANSAIIKKATYSQKYKVVGKVKTNVNGGTSEWYEVVVDGNLGYVLSTNAIKREFDWQNMVQKIEKMNKFLRNAANNGKTVYVLDDYTPLGGGSGTVKDKFGNRENQSERGYTTSDFKGSYINIPDRSLMTIVQETSSYIKVKIDVYDGEFYLKPSVKRLLKSTNINGEVKRFIYVDRHSQNEMIVEKNADSDTWNVVTASFVTTGKDAGTSFATPYGAFLVAYGKPVMQYTGADNKTIVGDAKNAVRFSGGGYMHSIPSLFEPKATREQRKAATARKIGTFAESHKCIRHYDDQIKFIYDWLGNATPGHKYGYRVPTSPVIMLVK